ncbi:methyltransferase domain-containing protein [Halomarina rubra]|uniref:Methyltransferase domain-containing protein n=1 Tax=Halomarina rubra TaxID=2071873 RepID=A0ABD6AR98_9EURY
MILLVHEDREYCRERGDTLETDLGVLEIPEDVNAGETLETHLGEPFEVREMRGPDLFNHLDRTGAPMMPRDIGLIIGHTGIAAGDRVLDAGTGTGILSAYLGRVGANVTTYEIDPEFAEVARSNMETAEVADHVDVRVGDLAETVDDLVADGERFDVLTLDTEDAPEVAARADDLLVPGGYLVAYVPFVEGTRAVVEAARESLGDVETFETIQRRMDVGDRGTRPSTAGVGHTGYLVFARA